MFLLCHALINSCVYHCSFFQGQLSDIQADVLLSFCLFFFTFHLQIFTCVAMYRLYACAYKYTYISYVLWFMCVGTQLGFLLVLLLAKGIVHNQTLLLTPNGLSLHV